MLWNSSKFLFMLILIFGSMITMSANNWLGMWMGLEMNLMSFIPFISNNNKNSSKAMMIYFISQSIGSIIMLFSIMMNMLILNESLMNTLIKMMIMISIMIKVGAAPFHFWLPEMMANLNWTECFILMTWQKMAPLVILNNLMLINWFFYFSVIMSSIVGSIGGLNQTSLRKMLAFSSINHLSWMMIPISMNMNWYKYLIIYTMCMMMICYFLNKKNTYYLNQLNFSSFFMEKMVYSIMMLSIGGLPPFLGFLPKWMVIQYMMNSNLNLVLLIMMLSSLLTLFYYLRMISPMILTYSTMNKWSYYNPKNTFMIYFMLMINLSLPLISVISYF
nr:NADH dehydrogenase subunit 2 [Hydarella orientalis]